MKRKIVEIDEELCNGCGQCVDACAEGAIQLVDGKARLVKDEFCDGLGACLGECPQGALRIVDREAPAFDPEAVAAHLGGGRQAMPTPAAHGAGHAAHGAGHAAHGAGHACPGSQVRQRSPGAAAAPVCDGRGLPAKILASELSQWPVQLHLVPIRAPFFADRELVVMSTCSPIVSADTHWRFLRGRSVVVACPKLDVTDPYIEKLSAIFAQNRIPRVLVVRMQVPCCGGLTAIVSRARALSGRAELPVDEVVLGLEGEVLAQRSLPCAEG